MALEMTEFVVSSTGNETIPEAVDNFSLIMDTTANGIKTFPIATSPNSVAMRLLENNSSVSITITNGGATTYVLPSGPGIRKILKFNPDGVFEYPDPAI